jgi:tellurite resistance protein TerA
MVLQDGSETITFQLPTEGMAETALIMGEVYRYKEHWKVRAVGQGFVGGLPALAHHLGVDITEERPVQPPSPPPSPSPGSAATSPGVRLHKVILEKNKPVSLEKGSGLGEILINLNWNRGPQGQQSRGLLQRLRGSGGIDLDLGCMATYRDGQKIVIQALGESFGSFERWPYLQLMGDDRTGSAAEGENLRLNGAHWDQFERALVYAFIYEGVPNWAQTDGVVTIRAPGHPELVVQMDSTSSNERCCAIALLENDRGNIRISKEVRYFRDQKVMDEGYGFGFRWSAGRK